MFNLSVMYQDITYLYSLCFLYQNVATQPRRADLSKNQGLYAKRLLFQEKTP